MYPHLAVSHYLWQLKEGGEISSDEFWDSDFRADLQAAVREELQSELSGDESAMEAKELARDIIEDELRQRQRASRSLPRVNKSTTDVMPVGIIVAYSTLYFLRFPS